LVGFPCGFLYVSGVRIRKATIEKSGEVVIRLGEAATIGAAASLFITDFLIANSLFGFVLGMVLVAFGLYLINIADLKGE